MVSCCYSCASLNGVHASLLSLHISCTFQLYQLQSMQCPYPDSSCRKCRRADMIRHRHSKLHSLDRYRPRRRVLQLLLQPGMSVNVIGHQIDVSAVLLTDTSCRTARSKW